MTLDETIKFYEEAAKKQENNAKNYPRPNKDVKGSGKKYNARIKCAKEYRQRAAWLKELKKYRAIFENIGRVLSNYGYTMDDLDTIFGKVKEKENTDG